MGNNYRMYGFLSSALQKIIASSRWTTEFNPKSAWNTFIFYVLKTHNNPRFLLPHILTTSIHIPIFCQILTFSRSITELNQLES